MAAQQEQQGQQVEQRQREAGPGVSAAGGPAAGPTTALRLLALPAGLLAGIAMRLPPADVARMLCSCRAVRAALLSEAPPPPATCSTGAAGDGWWASAAVGWLAGQPPGVAALLPQVLEAAAEAGGRYDWLRLHLLAGQALAPPWVLPPPGLLRAGCSPPAPALPGSSSSGASSDVTDVLDVTLSARLAPRPACACACAGRERCTPVAAAAAAPRRPPPPRALVAFRLGMERVHITVDAKGRLRCQSTCATDRRGILQLTEHHQELTLRFRGCALPPALASLLPAPPHAAGGAGDNVAGMEEASWTLFCASHAGRPFVGSASDIGLGWGGPEECYAHRAAAEADARHDARAGRRPVLEALVIGGGLDAQRHEGMGAEGTGSEPGGAACGSDGDGAPVLSHLPGLLGRAAAAAAAIHRYMTGQAAGEPVGARHCCCNSCGEAQQHPTAAIEFAHARGGGGPLVGRGGHHVDLRALKLASLLHERGML